MPIFSPVLPLPRASEPLVSLPPGKALAKPQVGLWDAIGNWLHSAGRLIALGFIVKRRRAPTSRPRRHAPQPSLRERTELIQLQAENRRLRQQLERMSAKTAQPPLSGKPEASRFPEPEQEPAPSPDAAAIRIAAPAEPARAGAAPNHPQ